MRILGIDYGKKKIGLAVSDGELAEPFKVIRVKTEEEGLDKVAKQLKELKVSKIVVGVSEGKMGEKSRNFGKKLREKLETPVVFQDETLTTHEAQELSIKAGIKRKKRKALEDAYAACLILQAYIDSLF